MIVVEIVRTSSCVNVMEIQARADKAIGDE